MTFTFKLEANDFLQYQLFIASQSARIRKERIKTWLIYSGAFLLLGFLFYQSDNKFLAYYFIVAAILSCILFPFYQRYYYKKHYHRFIIENYKNRFGQTASIELTDKAIETNDLSGASKINLSQIESITETGRYFYPKLKTGEHLIFPKQQIAHTVELRQELKQLSNRLNIPFIEVLDWKWK